MEASVTPNARRASSGVGALRTCHSSTNPATTAATPSTTNARYTLVLLLSGVTNGFACRETLAKPKIELWTSCASCDTFDSCSTRTNAGSCPKPTSANDAARATPKPPALHKNGSHFRRSSRYSSRPISHSLISAAATISAPINPQRPRLSAHSIAPTNPSSRSFDCPTPKFSVLSQNRNDTSRRMPSIHRFSLGSRAALPYSQIARVRPPALTKNHSFRAWSNESRPSGRSSSAGSGE